MLTFVGFNFVFNQQPTIWMDVGFMCIFYGLYFGVLGRDLSEICTDKMAANIGVSDNMSFNMSIFRICLKISVLYTARDTNAKFGAECMRCLWK